jgi:hypothetical protein
MVVAGLNITRGETDQHVHMLGLLVLVKDLDRYSITEGEYVDIGLPFDIPPVSNVERGTHGYASFWLAPAG